MRRIFLSLNDKPLFNSLLVFREDNRGVLYDPDLGNAFTLDPVSSFIWQRLDGKHSIADITEELREDCSDMPNDAEFFVKSFIQDLVDRGFAGYEAKP
jgi:SynChlorMet cassette protein ScmD